MQPEPFIECHNLVKIFKVADLEVVALQGLDLTVNQGEMMALVGASGAGKSTLLNVIGGLDTPSAGDVRVGGYDLLKMNNRQRVQYKRDVIGFVWQQPGRNLLPYLSAFENVQVPMMLTKTTNKTKNARAMELLDILGLAGRTAFRPDRLSGGEQQRVAMATAMANNPPLLLADEPTGQLDSEAANQVLEALRQINQTFGTTIIVVTHDPQMSAWVDRLVSIRDGRTSTEIRRERGEEEWVLLDKTSRLQLPQAYVDTLTMHGRVRVRLEKDHVSVWPERVPKAGEEMQSLESEQSSRLDDLSDEIDQRPRTVHTRDLGRTFKMGAEEVCAVRDVDLAIPGGVLAVIKGRSGSGKTTLLNLIGGLDEPSSGTIEIDGQDLNDLSAEEKIELRQRKIGFVFQTFGLLPFLSARENVEVPLRLVLASRRERKNRTDEVLGLVGLTNRAEHRIYELSGGEQQRVAIARALVKRPTLILADEPTGQLDTLTGASIMALLKEITTRAGVTVVVASHDPNVHEAADLVFELKDGRLIRVVEQWGQLGSGKLTALGQE